jgi:regulator of replication initiation timing
MSEILTENATLRRENEALREAVAAHAARLAEKE